MEPPFYQVNVAWINDRKGSSDRERAEKILLKSESASLITNSVKAKVSMRPTITVGS